MICDGCKKEIEETDKGAMRNVSYYEEGEWAEGNLCGQCLMYPEKPIVYRTVEEL